MAEFERVESQELDFYRVLPIHFSHTLCHDA